MSSSIPRVLPDDELNRALVANVHPADWVNPHPAERYNLVVIGAGTAGLVTAAAAAGLGARVALVERHLMGGDCLNVGCVPSKALLRSARAAADVRRAGAFGIDVPEGAAVDFGAVMRRVREVRARISPHDSAARFRSLGVDVFLGEGRFSGSDAVDVDGHTLRFRRAVVATGARAVSLPIEGLEAAGYLTNETVFALTERPPRLAVLGAGPIGCEFAQAFRRLGSDVLLIEIAPQVLIREDREAAAIVQEALLEEGTELALGTEVVRVEASAEGKRLTLRPKAGPERVAVVDEVLVGVGRAPNVEGLNLEAVGVHYGGQGIEVDDRLRTSNPRIFAAGDVCMDWKFTHAADFAARIVIQNTLFFGRRRLSALTMPWCTYTDPEIAHVGLYEHEAVSRGIEVDAYTVRFADVDRAIAEGDERGFVRILVRRGTDRLVGATIVAAHAGDLISEITTAMVGKVGLGTLANAIHPYPTLAEAIRKAGDAYNRTRLTPTVKRLFTHWLRWTR